MNQKLPLILSGLALATAVVAILPSKSESPVVQTSGRGALPEPDQAANPGATERVVVTPPAVDQGALEAQMVLLTDLQNRLTEIEDRLGEMKDGWIGLARRGLVPLSEEDVLNFQQQAMNTSLPIEERISALRMLRRHDKVSDGVIQSLAQFAQSTVDTEIREDIFEQMDGLTNPVLQGYLLSALGNEEDSGVRARLADALSSFSGDPDVQAWLRHLQESDPDERVQREARQALNQRLERMEPTELQQVMVDTTTSTSEKLAALGQLRRDDARTPEVLATAVGLYENSEDANVRAEVFRQLAGINDPMIMEPLLNGLSKDESSRVRGAAAGVLSGYREDPTVAAWLKYAAENDPDPGVQRMAQAALNGENMADRGRRGFRGRGR